MSIYADSTIQPQISKKEKSIVYYSLFFQLFQYVRNQRNFSNPRMYLITFQWPNEWPQWECSEFYLTCDVIGVPTHRYFFIYYHTDIITLKNCYMSKYICIRNSHLKYTTYSTEVSRKGSKCKNGLHIMILLALSKKYGSGTWNNIIVRHVIFCVLWKVHTQVKVYRYDNIE